VTDEGILSLLIAISATQKRKAQTFRFCGGRGLAESRKREPSAKKMQAFSEHDVISTFSRYFRHKKTEGTNLPHGGARGLAESRKREPSAKKMQAFSEHDVISAFSRYRHQ
jgi:hypothetical protein